MRQLAALCTKRCFERDGVLRAFAFRDGTYVDALCGHG
jgi:hypothetical protein